MKLSPTVAAVLICLTICSLTQPLLRAQPPLQSSPSQQAQSGPKVIVDDTDPKLPPATPSGAQAGEVKSPPTPSPASQPAAVDSAASKGTSTNSKGKKGKLPNSPPPPVESGATEKPYTIGPLDVLEIRVWNNNNLSSMYDVRPDGMISMHLIGEVRADGLTVPELTDVIKKKLAETAIEDPEVNIQVTRYNSKKFYIFGGCLRQGEFPLVGSMTVMDAFANCGGFKDFANLKKIYLLRGQTRYPFNYKDVSQGKHPEQNIRVQNGDRIFVPE